MKRAVAVFRRDVRRILRNPVAAAVVLGICVVPCLYAWINVLANWDPYANTSGVPVAVVNDDTPQSLGDVGEVCVGDIMEESLADNDKIGWQLGLSKEEALERVSDGTYYAAIVIPSNFTKRLTGIIEGKTEKAHLKYYVNEKVNPIAPKVADTGASTIENTIDGQFIAKVGEVISEKLGGAISKISSEAESTVGSEATALDEVHVTLVKVGDQLGGLSEGIRNAQQALSDAADDLEPHKGLGTRVSEKLDGVLEGMQNKRTDARNLIADINAALGRGMSSASTISTRANTDISAVAGDLALAQAQVNAAIRALENDLTDNEALTTTLTDARDLMIEIKPSDASAEPVRLDLQNELQRELDVMTQITETQQAKLEELQGIAQRLGDVANDVASASQSVDDKVQSARGVLQDAQTGAVGNVLVQINSALDTYVRIGSELGAAAKTVDPIISQTVSLSRQFSEAISGADDALEGTRSSLSELTDTVDAINSELAAIRASETWETIKDLVKTNPEGVHDFLVAPVEINEIDLFPMENYASSVAPFFTSVALWVGAIALVAIFKLEVDEEGVGDLRPWQAYFGRWMLFIVLGMVQAIICCTGDLVIGIQCAHPWALFLSAIVASFAFVNIVFALSSAFKHLGKALAFTLIILQVPGSAGMYPIEMMPPFFQSIGPWLPFTYSNNAMREAVGGLYETNLAFNLGMLLAFVVPAILLGVTARSHLVNINALFDRRLRETDHLMVIEPTAIEDDHYRLASVVKAIHSPDEYRAEFEERSAAFEQAYPKLVRRGLMLLAILPLGLFCLMIGSDAKLPAVNLFVASVIVIYAFLIVVEFVHDRIHRKRQLCDLSPEELEGVLHKTLCEELMPFARIDAILKRRSARAASASSDEASKGGDEQ